MFGLDVEYLAGQALLFGAVVLICYSGWTFITIRTEIGRRLRGRVAGEASLSLGGAGLSLDDSKLKQYEKFLLPENEAELHTIRRALIRAGYRKNSDVRMFHAMRIAMSAGALILSVIILPIAMVSAPVYQILLAMVLLVMIGFFMPAFWVERRGQARRQEILDGFPDALDLLLVCIEAGHGFDQALNRVVAELQISCPTLTEELQVVVREMRAGKEHQRVLNEFAERSGVEDIKSFVTVIVQADKFGVSIGQALRVYSAEMRDKRYMKAEEKANMLPIKLALGAIVFTVPPAIIVMVGPSVIMVIRSLGKL